MKRCDLRLVRIDTQAGVSVSSPTASSIVLSTWKKVCMDWAVLSCIYGLGVCTCTSLMTSGGRMGPSQIF